MPIPRHQLISLDATPYYHVISRCVRHQFLCGFDTLTGRDFSHRRNWIRARIFALQEVFAIDVCAYAVMSNHLHLVLRVDQEQALAWDEREVGRRWMALFGGNPLLRSFAAGESITEAQQNMVSSLIAKYRVRLYDISWFMRCLNEPIARRANAEDNVTGRFWEGRFKSQALLDEAAIITAMAYVDLNPVRARMAKTPEQSDYTSIQQRIVEQNMKPGTKHEETLQELSVDLRSAIGRLLPFTDQAPENPGHAIPYTLRDYLELVDWSGRAIVEGKRGRLSDHLPPILERLNVNPDQYLRFIKRTQKSRFHHFIGTVGAMRELAHRFGRSFLKGQSAAAELFGPS